MQTIVCQYIYANIALQTSAHIQSSKTNAYAYMFMCAYVFVFDDCMWSDVCNAMHN